jgi:GNAT superfamily N-acetyltransferase
VTPPDPRPGVSVRTAVEADAGRLAELLDGGALTAKEDPSDPRPYAAALADIAATPGNAVLVAELDGRIVGMCQLIIFRHLQERGGWCAEVESVHVAAAERSTGIGSALMAAAIQRAEAAGCYRVQLTSNRARTDAQRWYRRLGFVDSHVGFKYLLGGRAAKPGPPDTVGG